MSESSEGDGRLSRIRGAAASDDHRVKMFKELARLAPLKAPERPDASRLGTRAPGADLAVSDRR